MPICYGPVISKKLQQTKDTEDTVDIPMKTSCYVCNEEVVNGLKCLSPECDLIGHAVCLSKCFLKDENEYVPVEGKCPKCETNYLWGDLIRKFKGCYNTTNLVLNVDAGDDFYGSDSE